MIAYVTQTHAGRRELWAVAIDARATVPAWSQPIPR